MDCIMNEDQEIFYLRDLAIFGDAENYRKKGIDKQFRYGEKAARVIG